MAVVRSTTSSSTIQGSKQGWGSRVRGTRQMLVPPLGHRSAPDIQAQRNLQVFEAIAADDHLTQRRLAGKLGIALGLANIYLKRLILKGYVKCVNVRRNRLRYLLTPKGIAEKTRLTYEFMDYSLFLYGQVRRWLRAVLEPCVAENRRSIAVYGTGEAAELACLSLADLGLELVAVFDQEGGKRFLGRSVQNISEHRRVAFDVLLLATFESPEPIIKQLVQAGVSPGRLVTLRQ